VSSSCKNSRYSGAVVVVDCLVEVSLVGIR
jgi:hypothetical protein